MAALSSFVGVFGAGQRRAAGPPGESPNPL